MEGITKQLFFSGSKGVTARVTVKEDYSIENNTSSLTVFVDLACSRYFGHIYSLGGTLKVAGQTLWSASSSDGTNDVYIQSLDTYYPVRYGETTTAATWVSSAIAHEQDGSKTVEVSLEIYGYEASGKGSSGFNVSGSSNVALTHIPRASAIGATDANIGSVSTISVSRKSTAYQHSIQYSFGSLSGYVTSTGGVSTSEQKFGETSIPFSVPTSFYSQIPNSKTGVCTLTCRTYSGSAQIGGATTGSFTVTASAETSSPLVSGTVKDSNEKTVAVTGNDSVMVRYMSNALCTIDASARNNSSLVAKSINGTLISGDTLTVNGVSDPQIRFAAKDSRGYITDIPVRFNVVPYVLLTCVASVERTDPTSGNARLTIKGNYFSGSFGETSNSLSINYTLNGTTVSLSPTISNNTYTASADLTGLDYQKQYNISVSVVDKLSTVNTSVTVKKGIPVFDWGENDFAFHVPVTFGVGSTLKDIGITDFPTTMKTVVNAMGANTMLMLDSRLIVSGGEQEISDLGIGNAGMYMIFRGNSNARVTLLHIYGATGATTCYMNYGCYSATNNTVIWLKINEYPYLNTNGFTLSAGASKKFKIDSNIMLYGRVNLGVSAMAVYGIGAYSHIRAPIIAELSKGSNITVSSGGDNSNGWYIEVKNTSQGSASFFTVGSAVPVYM